MRNRETAAGFVPKPCKQNVGPQPKPISNVAFGTQANAEAARPGKGAVCPCEKPKTAAGTGAKPCGTAPPHTDRKSNNAFWDWIEIWNIVKQLNDSAPFTGRGTDHLRKPQPSCLHLPGRLPLVLQQGVGGFCKDTLWALLADWKHCFGGN